MKRYKYLIILITLVLTMVGLIIGQFYIGHTRDTNGEEDYSLQEINLTDNSIGISNYRSWNPDVRTESTYSLFSSSRVTGVVTIRTVNSNYLTFDVDVKKGNCEIVVMDYMRNVIYEVDLDGRSSVVLPETSNYYYVVMGAESADVTVSVQEN